MRRLEEWWERHSASRRYDRGPMYYAMILACFLTSISMVLLGPTPNGAIAALSPDLQNILAWVLFTGSGISLFAASTGSRFWFPNWSRVLSYGVGLIGIPLFASAMFFYGYAIFANTPNFASALGATLAPLLATGASVNGVYFWLEMKRIQRNVKFIKKADSNAE